MDEQAPRIRVPVLYPLDFKPGESENWIETVNECFHLAMVALHGAVMEAGWAPHQGVVSGPHEKIDGIVVPRALGFTPNEGETPVPLTNLAEGDESAIQKMRGTLVNSIEGFAVFAPNEDGDLTPAVTEEKRTFLIYQHGPEAWEKAVQKDGTQVVKVTVVWDAQGEAKRPKSGRR